MATRQDLYTKFNQYLSLLRSLRLDEDEIFDLTWSPDGQFLPAIGYGEVAHFIPSDASTLPYPVPWSPGTLFSIVWSPD